MALIAMAVYDTEANKRSDYTKRTLQSLLETVDFNQHELGISDNGSCEETQSIYEWLKREWASRFTTTTLSIIQNGVNLGTARGVNKILAMRKAQQYVIKMDNDVVIHQKGWVDLMEETIMRRAEIGILGLKRKDLLQCPWSQNISFRSTVEMVDHEPGQRWILIEHSKDIMGTCTMYNHELMDKIGGLRQPSVYGWDDVDYCTRSIAANFINCFLPTVEIDHIDTGENPYTLEKRKIANESGGELAKWKIGYINGTMPLYQNPEE